MKHPRLVGLVLTCSLIPLAPASAPQDRWSEAKANDWYAGQPWLVGSNYIPATAINELEMWQAETFDPATIDKELGWAEALGMKTMRVFLHDLPWQQDAAGFRERISAFSTSPRDTTSSRSSCCSIPVGIPIPGSDASANPGPACTIPGGCRAPEPRRCRTRRNIRD
jgi:hypothetical protein